MSGGRAGPSACQCGAWAAGGACGTRLRAGRASKQGFQPSAGLLLGLPPCHGWQPYCTIAGLMLGRCAGARPMAATSCGASTHRGRGRGRRGGLRQRRRRQGKVSVWGRASSRRPNPAACQRSGGGNTSTTAQVQPPVWVPQSQPRPSPSSFWPSKNSRALALRTLRPEGRAC